MSVAILAIVLLAIHVIAWITDEPRIIVRIIDICFVIIAIPLLTLTIRVTRTTIEWWFSFGLAKQCIELNEISCAHLIKTSVLSGVGVHWSGDYVLWAVSGFRAVMFDLVDGQHFAVSTSDAERLIEVIASLKQPV